MSGVVAALHGGEADGRELVVSGNCDRLMVPFLCGAEFCQAEYKKQGETPDGKWLMEYQGAQHREDERSLLFISPHWEQGLCRQFAESTAGKEFIAAHKTGVSQ